MNRVKERLKQYKWELEKQTQYKQGLPGSALDIVNTLLADLEEDEKKHGWIPVTEGLPEELETVLVWFEYYRYGNFNCMYQTYGHQIKWIKHYITLHETELSNNQQPITGIRL